MFRRIRQTVLVGCWCALLVSFGPEHAICGGEARRIVTDSLARTWGDCSGRPCVTLRVRYPLFSPSVSTVKVDSLNQFVQETLLGKYDPRGVSPVLSAVLDTLVGQFRALPSDVPHIPWHIERTIDVVGDTLGLLTLDVAESRFTGGAHPTTMHLYYVLDPSTMQTMTLDDLILPGSRDHLRSLAEAAFRHARNLKAGESIARAGFTFPGGNFELTMNVGLTNEGMLFYYNPYEIAPYVMGPTVVVVPWTDLRGILRVLH